MIKFGWKFIFQGTIAGIRDLIRMLTFRKPYYIPVVADPGTFAIMNSPDSKPGYMAIVPKDSSWENKCPARVCLMISFYRPVRFAHKVQCPALILLAEGGDPASHRKDEADSRQDEKWHVGEHVRRSF